MKHTSHARGWALVGAIAIAVATALDTAEAQLPTTLQDFQLPGTQPLSGTLPLQASFICGSCHGGYSEAHSPHSTWASSMMAQAGRDPVFYAALAVANQDAANSGDLCLRCHAPGGWLAGRAFPTDGSNLDNGYDDFDGITCHFCHRMVDPVAAPENPVEDTSILAALTLPPDADFHSGQFVIDPNDLRRGPFDLGAGFGLHTWAQSPFHRDSGMCGTCHDVSNPAFVRQTNGDFVLDTVNQPHPDLNYDNLFPIERTYSEWAMSVYGAAALDSGGRFGGNQPVVQSCQDCHMPTVNASACMPGLGGVTRPDMPKHEFNGANSWVLRAIDATWPDYETALTPARITAAEQRTQAMMSAAADLEAFTDGGDLVVRVTNHTGHKLPSGYGEGRRMWIEVQFRNASGTVIAEHGAYDALTADLDTATTKVYEVVHGIDNYMATQTGLAAGPSFHFVLNNEVVSDNRIPPRGFDSTAFASRGAELRWPPRSWSSSTG
ncbi:MAG: multiheme c-type cytochrome [Planctomycetota bacterium]